MQDHSRAGELAPFSRQTRKVLNGGSAVMPVDAPKTRKRNTKTMTTTPMNMILRINKFNSSSYVAFTSNATYVAMRLWGVATPHATPEPRPRQRLERRRVVDPSAPPRPL